MTPWWRLWQRQVDENFSFLATLLAAPSRRLCYAFAASLVRLWQRRGYAFAASLLRFWHRLGGVFATLVWRFRDALAALLLHLRCVGGSAFVTPWRRLRGGFATLCCAVGALLACHVGALLDDSIHTLRRMFLQVTRYGMAILVRSVYH